jgi:hypothetical protein
MLARVPVFRDNELPSLRLFDDTDAGWVVIQLHLQAGSGNEDEIPDGVVTRIWIAHFEKVFEEPEESFVNHNVKKKTTWGWCTMVSPLTCLHIHPKL